MLGKLARWLRMAGQNTLYAKSLPDSKDETILKRAKNDYRVLLTRDLDFHRQTKSQGVNSIYLENEDIPNQLVEISKKCGEKIEIDLTNSRCPVCNNELKKVEKKKIINQVPENVSEQNNDFWKCIKCGKIYWPGSHWESIKEIMEKYKKKLE